MLFGIDRLRKGSGSKEDIYTVTYHGTTWCLYGTDGYLIEVGHIAFKEFRVNDKSFIIHNLVTGEVRLGKEHIVTLWDTESTYRNTISIDPTRAETDDSWQAKWVLHYQSIYIKD